MFIRSKCNDYVVNSDQIKCLSVQWEAPLTDEDYEYGIIAEMVDGEEIWLDCSNDENGLKRELVRLTGKINDHPVQMYGTVNAYRCD